MKDHLQLSDEELTKTKEGHVVARALPVRNPNGIITFLLHLGVGERGAKGGSDNGASTIPSGPGHVAQDNAACLTPLWRFREGALGLYVSAASVEGHQMILSLTPRDDQPSVE